jgi:hypothetical protein
VVHFTTTMAKPRPPKKGAGTHRKPPTTKRAKTSTPGDDASGTGRSQPAGSVARGDGRPASTTDSRHEAAVVTKHALTTPTPLPPKPAALPRQLTQFSTLTGLPTHQAPESVVTDVTMTAEGASMHGTTNTPGDWFEVIRQKGRMGSESMLNVDLVAYVRNELFPKLKFFMDPRQLMFSTATNSICYQICNDMGLKKERSASWWELYKHKIVQTLNCKRADVTASIKRSFMSKWWVEVVTIICTLY